MEKENISVIIGRQKLSYEADPQSNQELEFLRLIKETGNTKPETMQDFFIRLNDLQKKQNLLHARETAKRIT